MTGESAPANVVETNTARPARAMRPGVRLKEKGTFMRADETSYLRNENPLLGPVKGEFRIVGIVERDAPPK